MILGEQYIFRLDISVEYTVSMHMVNGLEQLVHVILDPILW